MPFKSKKSKAKKEISNVVRHGRNPTKYSELNEKQRREYWTKKQRISRGRPSEYAPIVSLQEPAEKRQQTQPGTETRHTVNKLGTPNGRPTLFQNAMSPYTLKARRRFLINKAKRKKDKMKSAINLNSMYTLTVSILDQRRRKNQSTIENADSNDADGMIDNDAQEVLPYMDMDMDELFDEEDDNEDGSEKSNEENCDEDPGKSRSSIYNYKSKLIEILPKNPLVLLDLTIRCLPLFTRSEIPQLTQVAKQASAHHNFDLRYMRRKVQKLVSHLNSSDKFTLLSHWIQHASKLPFISSIICDIEWPQKFELKNMRVNKVARKLWRAHLSGEQPKGRKAAGRRRITADYAIEVAKLSHLDSCSRGNYAALANALGCDRRYAKSILDAIRDGKEHELCKPKKNAGSLLMSEWPLKLREFVFQSQNSRPINDKTVSVSYGVRCEKYLLLDSKKKHREKIFGRKSRLHVQMEYASQRISKKCTYPKS